MSSSNQINSRHSLPVNNINNNNNNCYPPIDPRQCRPPQPRLACNSLQDHSQLHNHHQHHQQQQQQQHHAHPQIQMRNHCNINKGSDSNISNNNASDAINDNNLHPPQTHPPPPPLVHTAKPAVTTNSLNQNHYHHPTTIVENQQHFSMTQQVTSNHNVNNHQHLNHHHHSQQQHNYRHQYHNNNLIYHNNTNQNHFGHNHVHDATNNSNNHVSHNHMHQLQQQETQHSHSHPIQSRPNDLPPLPPHPNTIPQNSQNNNIQNQNGNITSNNSHQDYYTEIVIHAILEAKDAMNKPIEERDERDILLIDYLCSLVHGFDPFPKTIRRALAAQAVLIVIEEKGKELIVHSEELDSFCVLIFGECVQLDATKSTPVRYYHIGDSFGVCEPTTETIRFVGNMITKSENCAFLCVKRDDFYTILTDPANYPSKETIRHRDKNGTVICVSVLNSDKKSSGPLWSHHMQSSNSFKLADGHVIVKANEQCLLLSLVDGYDRVDNDYIDDFLLLFRVFMTEDPREHKRLPPGMIKLCLTLKLWLNQADYRDKIVKIILEWLSSYYFDFEVEPEFSHLFMKDFAARLMDLGMTNHLQLLHSTLSAKSKIRNVTISRSIKNQPLGFSIAGGYYKNCGIFVNESSHSRTPPYDNLNNYLNYLSYTKNASEAPPIPPRNKTSNPTIYNQHQHQDSLTKSSVILRPGDQIIEVNGVNFSSIMLEEAQNTLDKPTHLSLTVKYNPSAYYEMLSLTDGRRKTNMSSGSPFLSANGQTKFTFNPSETANILKATMDQAPPPSPLFSNSNFGFKSIMKDKSRISSLISSSKSFVKQIRESTMNTNNGANLETMSRASDNISDDQSNDVDMGKTKSNPELTSLRSRDLGLNNVVRLDEQYNLASITENSCGSNSSLVNVLRIFNAVNNDSRYIVINEETTAREIVTIAVKEFNVLHATTSSTSSQPSPNLEKQPTSSALDWYLYEVSFDPESKTIKKKLIPDHTARLAERSSLCSRYYIKNNSATTNGPSKLDMETDNLRDEILKESPPNVSLASLNATLLAVELTLADFDKFKTIEPQQFVYDTFFHSPKPSTNANGSTGGDSASLKSSSSDSQDSADLLHLMNKSRIIPASWMKEYREFADISNKEMFWVVCEILNERNLARRVKIIKQFIRIADVCFELRNFNSMFAIISGLGNSCVGRLKRSFEKLKPKYKNQLEKMRQLFDPSRNMSAYRIRLQQTPPPAIPLFPQIKKDLTFTKEGRAIFVRESNDHSDDEEESGFGYSQDTIKRRCPKTTTSQQQTIDNNNATITNVTTTTNQSNKILTNNCLIEHNKTIASKSDTVLINFAEIRKFTERVRNVTHYSSSPYSNDLLTNTKESQRSQAQIRRMHDEWQMRKRIRYYITHTLINPLAQPQQDTNLSNVKSSSSMDQVDSGCSSSCSSNIWANTNDLKLNQNGRLFISYDERLLYQRSLEIEPELNQPQARANGPERSLSSVMSVQTSYNNNGCSNHHQQISQQHTPLLADLMHPITPLEVTMQAPFVITNQSPTLSKSSSLSSCSSFIPPIPPGGHHLNSRNNLMSSSVGKFGTESTESLRKLQSLSENIEGWRPFPNPNNANNNNINNEQNPPRPKGLVPSRMFPSKNLR